MPEPVYDDVLTRESQARLIQLVEDLPQPVTLAGGHAVRYVVREGWRTQFNQGYFGSRDIDVCYHVNPDWTETQLRESAAGEAPRRIREIGYERSGMFRFVLKINNDGDVLEGEPGPGTIAGIDFHKLYLDLMVTHEHPSLEEVLGFTPIDEPLLAHAFTEENLRVTVEELGSDVYVPTAPLLTATKLASLPERAKGDKAVKDLCDLYALADYGGATSQEIRRVIHRLLDNAGELVDTALNHSKLEKALDHLDVSPADYTAVVGPLEAPP